MWLVVYIASLIIGWISATDICVNIAQHRDVSPNKAPGIVEQTVDYRECLARCLVLKDTMPCKAVVYSETRISSSNGLCKMYSSKMGPNLVSISGPTASDATYYDLLDQCTSQSQIISIDKDSVDPTAAPGPIMTTQVIIVHPDPVTDPVTMSPGGGGIIGPGPGPNGGSYPTYGQGGYGHRPESGGGYVNSQWGPWNDWTSCSVTCGAGQQMRDRPCVSGRRAACSGIARDTKSCVTSNQPCYNGARLFAKEAPFVPFRPFKPTAPPFREFRPVG